MIDYVYQELRRLGAAKSKTEFGAYWLGKDGSYFRGGRCKSGDVSVDAIVTCAARLRQRARLLHDSSYTVVRAQAAQYESLAQLCIETLLTEAEAN